MTTPFLTLTTSQLLWRAAGLLLANFDDHGKPISTMEVMNEPAWFRALGCKARRSSSQDDITYTTQAWQRLPKADFLDNEPPIPCD